MPLRAFIIKIFTKFISNEHGTPSTCICATFGDVHKCTTIFHNHPPRTSYVITHCRFFIQHTWWNVVVLLDITLAEPVMDADCTLHNLHSSFHTTNDRFSINSPLASKYSETVLYHSPGSAESIIKDALFGRQVIFAGVWP